MKILIVDDEMMIKEWLKYTISTLPFEVSLIDTASNGLEALDKVKDQHFDLIFIDITMPKMNGIDLLRNLNEQAVNSMMVVLSSHDEFQFAKEAIRYNIKEYVLKNECSKEKLSEILHSCYEKLQNSRSGSQLTQEFMERVLNNTIASKGLDIVKLNFPRLSGKLFFTAVSELEKELVHSLYEDDVFRIRYEGMIGRVETLYFHLFSIESKENRSHFDYDYSKLLYVHINRKISCGRLCRDPDDILNECRNAWIGYQSLFYSTESFCFGKFQFHDLDTAAVDSLCETAISDIRSYEKEKTLINLYDLNAYFSKYTPSDVDSVVSVYLSIVDTFIVFNNSNSRNITRKLDNSRQLFKNLERFHELSSRVLELIESNIDLVDRSRYSPAVEKALEFIEQNYQDITNVMEISDSVNLSLDYFSRLFKKEVGDTLNSYLVNFRMEKASVILISSNLSVQEVAQRVGIENGSYFSKCFKKKFNTQPIQFRIQTRQSDT
ncbi:MAG: response regulator [Spirochaetales bacterium]|nr:response regulator [Spirochaetales bacterium]